MLIGQEGISTQVIGTNPDGIGRGRGVESNASGLAGSVIGEESRDLIIGNGREGGVDGAPNSRCEVVRANGTGDCIVVEFHFGRFRRYSSPRLPTTCGAIALFRIKVLAMVEP